ncbi:hypothetical protein [Neoaquamicrobium sediminum]|uniref:Apea-like HEPN domain-containing protein n=1 Tax=Neoaquamicrobium sediminum TaxID=1849104 RepID=A0ABV3WXK9_9HYPH
MNDSFYVCFYKGRDGDRIGHGVSSKNEFPKKLSITIDQDNGKSDKKFGEIFKEFCDSMNGYMDMMPLLAGIGSAITYNIRESELVRFCEENSLSRLSDGNREIFEIPLSRVGDFNSIDLRHRGGQLVSKQIPKMLLMGVVSSLDHHIAQLMREVVRRNPAMLSSSEKNVSIQDVFLADSIDEFKEILIEREIESATRESFEDQIGWFERKIPIKESIKMQYDLWDELIEVIERRNLFAHANGIANTRYIKKTSRGERSNKISVGHELFASSKYFSSSLDNICEFGVKICQVIWRKIDEDDSAQADKQLGDFGFNLIERGEYKLACRILEFSLNLRGKRDEARRRVNIVNLANAYKLSGSEEKSLKLLDGEDWEIVSDEFAVSVAAVRGDVDRVGYYMARMAQSGDWTGEELEQWPVFYHVRDDARFIKAFEEAYKRKYSPAPRSRNRILENFYKASKSKKGLTKTGKQLEVVIEAEREPLPASLRTQEKQRKKATRARKIREVIS